MEKQELTDEQKDFICRRLAQFIPHRKIAEALRAEWPELEISNAELIMRIKYYSSGKKAAKWQARIRIYRNLLNTDLQQRFALTNRFKRLRLLEKIVEQAMQPHLTNVHWYPDERDEQGRVTYRHEKVYRCDTASAIKAVSLIVQEIKGLSGTGPAYLSAVSNPEGLSLEDSCEQYDELLKQYHELDPITLEDEDIESGNGEKVTHEIE